MKIKSCLKFKISSKIFISIIASIVIIFTITFYSQNQKFAKAFQNSTKQSIKLPIIMYHFISKGEDINNKFTISAKTFEEDLKYLSENGYTTILVNDLINYTENGLDLPEKPIILTFDDGAYNNYCYAYPLAQKYNAKFIFSPIAKECDKYSSIDDENPTYAYTNWRKIKEMSESGLVEIQNHTYDMHKINSPRTGCSKLKTENFENYKSKLSSDLEKAQNLISEKTNFTPTAIVYPFGAFDKNTEKVVKSLGFKASFTCEEKVNIINRNPETLYSLGRFLRPPYISSEKFFKKLEQTHKA